MKKPKKTELKDFHVRLSYSAFLTIKATDQFDALERVMSLPFARIEETLELESHTVHPASEMSDAGI